MENTACGNECPFVKQGFCQNENQCPHYMESWWIKAGEEKPQLIKDCAPKRMILQQQNLQVRLESVQQALEQSRNEYATLCSYLKNLIEVSKTAILNQNKLEEVKHDKYIALHHCDDNACKLHSDDNDGTH